MSADREQLEAWIVQTQRTQRRLRTALVPAGVIALLLLIVSRPIGGAACGMVGLFALFGFWITNGHIEDWQRQIGEIGKPKPVGRAIKRREP